VVDAPADHPQYAPGYHAVLSPDPDGVELVYVHTRRPK
jgi:hypothetical protein